MLPMESTSAAASFDRYSELDRWFDAIDHQQIGTGLDGWTAEVVGIHSSDGDLWVQVSPTEWPGNSVVLRVAQDSSMESALTALADCQWPVTSLQVIDVRREAWERRAVSATPVGRQATYTPDSSQRAWPYRAHDRLPRATPNLKLRSKQTRRQH